MNCVRGKMKIVFLAAAVLFVAAAYKYTRDGSLKPDFSVDIYAVGQKALDAVFPGGSYDGADPSDGKATALEEIIGWVRDTLFPADAYVRDAMADDALSSVDEYYPSQKDLEAFCEENENYEALEREAESRKAESEAQAAKLAAGDGSGGGAATPGGGAGPSDADSGTAAGSGDGAATSGGGAATSGDGDTAGDGPIQTADAGTGGQFQGANSPGMASGDDGSEAIPAVATPENAIIYPMESLYSYTFLLNNFYVVDSSTASDASLINGETLLNKDLTMDLAGEEPKILIYHTHSQEKFADSAPGDPEDSVVGLGSTLAKILQEKYHISVYHDTGVYDMIDGVEDRNESYSLALDAVEKILAENPSIKVVIDLHRDGVAEGTHLVTTVNGKPTAKIMFFNGLCRSASGASGGYLQNPYLEDNLAFSLQMQIKAAEKYPEFTRRIYLRNYRFNMHVMPRTLLVECGAQTNTVEEVQNAMEPLADILYCVLSGQ